MIQLRCELVVLEFFLCKKEYFYAKNIYNYVLTHNTATEMPEHTLFLSRKLLCGADVALSDSDV